MKSIFPLYFFLISWPSYGLPTPEGLLRNANNKQPTGNTATVEFMIEELRGIEEGGRIAEGNGGIGYYKMFIGFHEDNIRSLLQVNYGGNSMKDEDIRAVYFFRNMETTILNEISIERTLFYSLMAMMTVNNSSLLSKVLQKISPYFQTNKELMNKRKADFYKRYKEYLLAKQRGSVVGSSPMNPSDPRVGEIMKEPMYANSERVSLIRRGREFYWRVDLGDTNLFFTNEQHRFSELSYGNTLGRFSIRTGEYARLDGTHELPKEMLFSSLNGKHYRLRFLALAYTGGRTKISDRARGFRQKKPKNNPSVSPLIPIVF